MPRSFLRASESADDAALFQLAVFRVGSGANMAFRARVLARIGGFDPATGAGSRATGGDEQLDPAEVHQIFEMARPMDDIMRGSGAFGAKVEPPAGADEQTQLLAFLGRPV